MLSIFIVLSTLKVMGIITWEWAIVCIPLYYAIFNLLVIGFILFFVLVLYILIYKRSKTKRKENPSKLDQSINFLEAIQKKLKAEIEKKTAEQENKIDS